MNMPIPSLPDDIPLFPLAGAVLLPTARLPLNIFEPRYRTMVDHVLGQPGRLIGMVQPKAGEGDNSLIPPVYKIGCAGRITSLTETEDGRYLIGLTGLCRFAMVEELITTAPFRSARVDWSPYLDDLNVSDDTDIDRKHLIEVMEHYFKLHGVAADWNAIQSTPNHTLISSLVMICPLPPNEKQALLEAPDLRTRMDLLATLLEMALHPQGEGETAVRH